VVGIGHLAGPTELHAVGSGGGAFEDAAFLDQFALVFGQ